MSKAWQPVIILGHGCPLKEQLVVIQTPPLADEVIWLWVIFKDRLE